MAFLLSGLRICLNIGSVGQQRYIPALVGAERSRMKSQ